MTDDDLYDADGRALPTHAARLLATSVIRTEAERWTKTLVRARLKEAAKGIDRVVARPGPAATRGFWPQTFLEWGDLVQMAGTEALEELHKSRNSAGGSREIGRIEEAIAWPIVYLGADEHEPARQALACWMWCQARNQSFNDFHHSLGCALRTAFYRRDVAFDVIMAGLIRDNIQP